MPSQESKPIFSDLKLSKVESFQAERRATTPELEQAKIQLFAHNPEIRKKIVENPISEESMAWMKNLPNPETIYSVLRTAILTEPNGEYETNFAKLSRAEQREELYEQIDSSANISMRLEEYFLKNIKEFETLSDAELYQKLTNLAFETSDPDEIEKKFALSQRRGFRQGIVNFLEERSNAEKYKAEAKNDPQAFTEQYLGFKPNGKVVIEILPIGFIFYLDELDYAVIRSGKLNTKTIDTLGMYFQHREIGDAIVINKGGIDSGEKTIEEINKTKEHELKHLIFNNFHQMTDLPYEIYDYNEPLIPEKVFKESKSYHDFFIERIKDEIIAYFSEGRHFLKPHESGINKFEWFLEGLLDNIMVHNPEVQTLPNSATNLKPITDELQKIPIFAKIEEDRLNLLKIAEQIFFVAANLFTRPDDGAMNKTLIKMGLILSADQKNDFAEALLRNTPAKKIHRLAKYIGLTEEDIKAIDVPKNLS